MQQHKTPAFDPAASKLVFVSKTAQKLFYTNFIFLCENKSSIIIQVLNKITTEADSSLDLDNNKEKLKQIQDFSSQAIKNNYNLDKLSETKSNGKQNIFIIEVWYNDILISQAQGFTKKDAEQEAARIAIDKLS